MKQFLNWLKDHDSDTLLDRWKRKRAKDREKAERERPAKLEQKAKAEAEYRERIKREAYLLWEADGKPEGKDEYYWIKAIDKITGRKVPTIYKPYYWIEKSFLEPADAWISKQAFFTILGRLGNLAIVVAVVAFVFGENVRRNNEVFSAWQTITSAHGQSGSGGRIKAIEFLNSRPLRFPWIGWTEKDLYWDKREKRCKPKRLLGLRWERQPLIGLSVPNRAYLAGIHLCDANLSNADLTTANLIGVKLNGANLSNANLEGASLTGANLTGANLSNVKLAGADLTGANLIETTIIGTKFINLKPDIENTHSTEKTKANLESVILINAGLFEVNLKGINLEKADLEGADLSNVSLEGANLYQANLVSVDAGLLDCYYACNRNYKPINLNNANLLDADLRGANLRRAELKGATLWGADLRGANLERADLREAKMKSVSLNQITWTSGWNHGRFGYSDVLGWKEAANLERANLKEANLREVDLRRVDLRGADLRGADLRGADLRVANLQEAFLINTKNLIPKQIKSACYWQEAKFAPEFEAELKKEPDQEVGCSLFWEEE